VAINYFPIEESDAQEVISYIKAEGRIGVAIPGDLRDERFCAKLVEDALQGLGGLDVIVNNAARQQSRESILEVSNEDFDATMKTNVYAPFWIIKSALPHLKPGACIIATTSEQAYDPSAELYDYAQTKAATMNYVKSLAKQLGPKGIRVNGVAPSPIWTPLQVSGGAPAWRSSKSSEGKRYSNAPDNRPSWHRFMFSSHLRMRLLRPAKYMDRQVATDSLDCSVVAATAA
jgi:NAD(P)-dependent dehydrogenase (short-subunit alcohol dehydrogenase family)